MSNSYYASATFPKSAAIIPEIAAYLKEKHIGIAVEEFDDLIQVADETASSGNLEITFLLDENDIPYDHYHRDENSMSVYTVKVRYDETGDRIEVTDHEGDDLIKDFAREAKELLEQGRTEELYQHLDGVLLPTIKSIEEVAAGETVTC